MPAQAACELLPHMHVLSWRRSACSHSQSRPTRTTTTLTGGTSPSPSSSGGSHVSCFSGASQSSEGSNSGDDPTYVGIRDSLDLYQTTSVSDVSLVNGSSDLLPDSEETLLGPSNDVHRGSSAADDAAFWATSASGGSSGVRPAAWAPGRAGRRAKAAAGQQPQDAGSNTTCTEQGPSSSRETGEAASGMRTHPVCCRRFWGVGVQQGSLTAGRPPSLTLCVAAAF